MRTRESGAVLLAVSIVLALTAALAFTLNREGAAAVRSVDAQYDSEAARYLAEAAFAQARWINQTNGCGNASVATMTLGTGDISANVVKAPSKTIDIVATGSTDAGANFVIRQNGVVVRNLSNTSSADLGGASVDTYISASAAMASYGGAPTLALASDQSNVLLLWPSGGLPADVVVTSATLILTQTATSSTARPITVHRVLRAWDNNATWNNAQPGAAWSVAGGDISGPVARASAGSTSTVSWDVTGLVEGWNNRTIVNRGMLLKLANAGQGASFHSKEAAASNNRPVLRVRYAKPC